MPVPHRAGVRPCRHRLRPLGAPGARPARRLARAVSVARRLARPRSPSVRRSRPSSRSSRRCDRRHAGRARGAARRGGARRCSTCERSASTTARRATRATRGRATSRARATSTSTSSSPRGDAAAIRALVGAAGRRRGDRLLPLGRPLRDRRRRSSRRRATRRATTSAPGTSGRPTRSRSNSRRAMRSPRSSSPATRRPRPVARCDVAGTRCRARGRARSRLPRNAIGLGAGRRPGSGSSGRALDEPVVEHVPRHLRVELDAPRALAEPVGLARRPRSRRAARRPAGSSKP